MTVGVAGLAASGSTTGFALEAEVRLAALSAVAGRLSDFAVEAAELDERAADTARRERRLAELAKELAETDARQAARAAELDARERALSQEGETLSELRSLLVTRAEVATEMQQELLKEARALEARAARFHWRWFLRAWSWRPPPIGSKARVCELLFVPSSAGYKLLEQNGIALTPRAHVTGLLDEHSSYVVTKIAQWPLDGRWCAYLETNRFARGGSDD
jgi:hypothetical protein